MPKPFLELNLPLLRKGVASAKNSLDEWSLLFMRCVADAMALWMSDVLQEAAERAPVGKGVQQGGTEKGGGDLRASWQVVGPELSEASIDVLGGFNKVYARIRDQGGEIRPVKAKSLFIPLRPGARPGDRSLKLGVDFVLVPGPTTKKTFVTQLGNRYFTGVLNERAPKAAEEIGKRAQSLFAAWAGGKPGETR